jgi:Tol biopolymer transport system component/DNA-binding winged helix-turn-helix (wHTH) protein
VAEAVDSSQIVRFGVFEVDLHSGELRRSGLKLKLTGQPFQVLVILLEHAGKVVTREELQKRLWPETFVDVDHNLNTAINRIREVLGDSAENPRFVETLPRRGYRFILPLNGAHSAAMSSSAAVGAESVAAATARTYESAAVQREGRQTRSAASHYAVVAGALLVCAGLAIYFLTRSLPLPTVTNSAQLTSDGQAKTLTYANELIPPLVSDGSRLYFVECAVGGTRLAQVSTEGGETTSFPAGFRVRRVLDVSPKRQELLALTYDGTQFETALMVLPLPAGAPHRVGDVLAHDASWSPDGKQIVYANGHDLYVSKVDGSEPRKLVTTPDGNAWWPRWSSDGKLVRFTVLGPYESRRIWEVSADGSRAHPLFSGGNQASDECCGNWTPDGKYFVFQYEDQLWAVRDAASFLKKPQERVRLTTGPMSMVAPLPGANGKRIFVVAKQPRGQLVRYDRNTLQFVPFLSGISSNGVDFSKDGQWVTYVAFPEGTLWRSKTDGSERLQLTLPPMKVALPRWSPDGKHIAFLGEGAGRPAKLYIVSAEGGATTQAVPGDRNEGEASWSPDGNSLVFAPLFWLEGSTEIRFLDMKSGQVTTLPGSAGYFSARWSPDGRHIAALRANSQTLMLLDLKTQKWQELAKSAAYPNWSRDGSYIHFVDPYTNEAALYRVRISDRKVEQLATLNSQILAWASAGKWTGLAPDDSPLVLRDTSVEEVYALDWEALK